MNPDEMIRPANDALTATGIDIGRQMVPFINHTMGGALAYFAGGDDARTIEQTLSHEFGDQAPAVRVTPGRPKRLTLRKKRSVR